LRARRSTRANKRLSAETPGREQRDSLWRYAFDGQLVDAGDRASLPAALAPASLLATLQWLYPPTELRDDQRASWRFCHAVLQANAGDMAAARAGLEALRNDLRAAGRAGRLSQATGQLLTRLGKSR
jgi:hypothetical protein